MKTVLSIAAAAFIGLFCTQALAQSEAEGQQACGNDVFALCQQAIPDRGRIEACLRRNFRRVSPTCRQYMASYGRSHRTMRRASRRHYYSQHRTSHHYSSRHYRRHHRTGQD